jgi:uncharacterized protein (DUF58 family)
MALGKHLLQIIAVIFIIALVLGQWILALLCLLVLLTLGSARLWQAWALYRVGYERVLSDDRLFPSDQATLMVRLANRKLLPLARVELYDLVSQGIEVLDRELVSFGRAGERAIFRSISVGWYEAVAWRYQLHCPRRGAYQIGPVTLRASDPFGLRRQERTDQFVTRLIVYPRLLEATQLQFDLRQLLGDVRAQQRLLVDPVRTIGVRDYHPDDPFKNIHWNATARRGDLQTQVYEPVTSLELVCALDVDTFEYPWQGIQPDEVERAISTAATVCQALVEAKHRVGLITNSAVPEHSGWIHVPPGNNPQQFARLLETLAVLRPYSMMPMGRLLRNLSSVLFPSVTVLLISVVASEATQAALLRLRQAGYPIHWIFLGTSAPVLPGVSIYHAPPKTKSGPRMEAA